MGQRVSGVQDTGHIVGLAGLYTADGVRELNPLQPEDGNKHHAHKKSTIQFIHMTSDL